MKADFAAIGKVDEFVYRLVGANGQLDTAKLFIRIGGDRTDLTWSTTDPSAPATETGSVVVTDNHDLSEVTVVKRKEYTELSDDIGYTIAVGALTGVIYAPFTEVDKSTHFSTDDRTVSTVTVQFLQGSGAALGMMTEVKLVNNDTGAVVQQKSYFEVFDSVVTDVLGDVWNTIVANGQGWPGDMKVRFFNVPAGNWSVVVDSKPYVVSAASFVSGSVSVETEYLVEYVATASHPAHGNVITDDSGDGVDKVPSGAILTIERPNGSYVVPNYDGIQIKGDYGTLWIRSNGDYTYTPSTYSLDAIGKVDTFTYTINGQNGKMDSGVITFRINASALPNEWDSLDAETFNYEVNIDAQNRLVGTAENDVLDGRVVQDANVALTFQGGAGDDVFIVYSAGSNHFAHANGGAGTDTLLWNAKDANLVLSSIADKIDNVEAISLKDSHDSAQTLVLTVDDFLKVTDGNLTDGRHSLFVRGDNNDKADIELAASANGQGWVLNGENVVRDGVTYVTYSYQLDGTHQTAYQLLIEQGMTVI